LPKLHKFDCQLVRTILFFVVPHQFSQAIGEWPENQILIPDWTYFHCPGATPDKEGGKIKQLLSPAGQESYRNPMKF